MPKHDALVRAGSWLLRARWFVRAPIWVYRAGLGVLLGPRLLMIEHIGRSTGQRRYVVVETFDRPAPDTVLVVSGLGPRAQWYRNLLADPSARVWTGTARAVPARAERLSDDEADQALDRYVARHPRAWRRLRPVVERAIGHPVSRGADLPVLALRLRGGPAAGTVHR